MGEVNTRTRTGARMGLYGDDYENPLFIRGFALCDVVWRIGLHMSTETAPCNDLNPKP